ncbi:MAG: type II toxin-antitoxin system VapC family toxin [Gaiella sp.]
MTLVCDTSVLYAALDVRERDHARCAALLEAADDVIVPAPTLVELDQLAARRGVPHTTQIVLDDLLRGAYLAYEHDLEDLRRIRVLVERYADLPLGFVDASVVTTAERLGETSVATLDHRHFSVVRPAHVPRLALVP